MDLQDIGVSVSNWIDLAQDFDYWRTCEIGIEHPISLSDRVGYNICKFSRCNKTSPLKSSQNGNISLAFTVLVTTSYDTSAFRLQCLCLPILDCAILYWTLLIELLHSSQYILDVVVLFCSSDSILLFSLKLWCSVSIRCMFPLS